MEIFNFSSEPKHHAEVSGRGKESEAENKNQVKHKY